MGKQLSSVCRILHWKERTFFDHVIGRITPSIAVNSGWKLERKDRVSHLICLTRVISTLISNYSIEFMLNAFVMNSNWNISV